MESFETEFSTATLSSNWSSLSGLETLMYLMGENKVFAFNYTTLLDSHTQVG